MPDFSLLNTILLGQWPRKLCELEFNWDKTMFAIRGAGGHHTQYPSFREGHLILFYKAQS